MERITGATGRIYSDRSKSITKLAELSVGTEYEVIKRDDTPTKYGSYVITIKVDDEELQVYMPKYIADEVCAIGE